LLPQFSMTFIDLLKNIPFQIIHDDLLSNKSGQITDINFQATISSFNTLFYFFSLSCV